MFNSADFFAGEWSHFKGELFKHLATVKIIEGTKTMKKSYTKIEKLKFIIFLVVSILMAILVFKYDHFKNIVLTFSLTMILINKIRDAKKDKKPDYLSIGLWLLLTFTALLMTVMDFIQPPTNQ